MLATLHEIAGMAAEGFGLEKDTFHKMMKFGPHLLAPTGSNFNQHGKLNTVLAGYHYGNIIEDLLIIEQRTFG